MTTCYFVSDLHGDRTKYELLAKEIIRNKPSFLFMGGDLLPHFRVSEKKLNLQVNPFIYEFLIPLFRGVQKQLGCNYPDIYLIAGNDDYKCDIPGFEEGARKELWKFLNNDKTKFGPYMIFGYSYVPPTPFRIKDWEKYDVDKSVDETAIPPDKGFRSTDEISDESFISTDLEVLTSDLSMEKAIFLFHAPPFDSMLDKIPGGKSIGSKAIANFIKEKQPYITLHGHAHESSGITGNWSEINGRTHLFSAAYDGTGLAIVQFKIDDPWESQRKIVAFP